MTGRQDRDFENIIGNLNFGDNDVEPKEDSEQPASRALLFKLAALRFVFAIAITAFWGLIVGLGTMFLLDALYQAGATALPRPGAFQSWLIGVSAILIVSGLRHGSN